MIPIVDKILKRKKYRKIKNNSFKIIKKNYFILSTVVDKAQGSVHILQVCSSRIKKDNKT